MTQCQQIGLDARRRIDPHGNVVRVLVLLEIARGQLGLSDPAQPANDLAHHGGAALCQRFVQLRRRRYAAAWRVTEGETVVLRTRMLGLWILAACRVELAADEQNAFGFAYATLPDHPECGRESFVVRRTPDEVCFEIAATSKPGIPLVRLSQPVARHLKPAPPPATSTPSSAGRHLRFRSR